MHNISIFGTSSDSGKSIVTALLAKALQKRGYKTAPFKAQNVSNNARVCDDGSEIGVAQYFQAKILPIKTSYHLNPILLKSGSKGKVTLILKGKAKGEISFKEYLNILDTLKPAVKESFNYLDKNFDIVICEGAGSPVELNLLKKDLSNSFVAKEFKTKIILVADIERGGVFASIWGVYNLLEKEIRENVIGVIINKFRGDISFFKDGIKIIEEKFKIPVLGVLPYFDFNLFFEDSQSILNYSQNKNPKIRVGILKLNHISNFTDFEPLIADSQIEVSFCKGGFEYFDLIIVPGSKLTIEDLKSLKKEGIFKKLKNYKKPIFGICGGFEMMFEKLIDKEGVENSSPIEEEGFGFIKDKIIFKNSKITKAKKYKIFGFTVDGYEIRNAKSLKNILFFEKDNIFGTFVHGIFDDNEFRTHFFKKIDPSYEKFDFKKYKEEKIGKFLEIFEKSIDLDKIERCLQK